LASVDQRKQLISNESGHLAISLISIGSVFVPEPIITWYPIALTALRLPGRRYHSLIPSQTRRSEKYKSLEISTNISHKPRIVKPILIDPHNKESAIQHE
jgi:hypothetical protein